jgi:16S rRNA (cytidine1402-2'-O)-methyltransferase
MDGTGGACYRARALADPEARADGLRPGGARVSGAPFAVKPGTLYLVATPIGNLGDITRRALDTLAAVDQITAEDPQRTRRLLEHFGIGTPVTKLFEHNERARIPAVLRRLGEGATIAVVTDAGSPGVSDPGFPLVRAVIEAGLRVESVPGPSAVITALQVSGLPTDAFTFAGFLPPRPVARRNRLTELSGRRETIVVFESPHRIERCLEDVEAVWGERPIALARELTKAHEEVLRGTAALVRSALTAGKRRGEMVLVLSGLPRREARKAGMRGGER